MYCKYEPVQTLHGLQFEVPTSILPMFKPGSHHEATMRKVTRTRKKHALVGAQLNFGVCHEMGA